MDNTQTPTNLLSRKINIQMRTPTLDNYRKQPIRQMRDLAPGIYRQRLVIEGYPARAIIDTEIKQYLKQLSEVLGMVTLIEPVTHRSDKYGEAAWIHWETSGAHFYAWDQPLLFFSVDIYTCKAFKSEDAVEFTRKFFNATDIEHKDF
jgi:hypothetical protein